MEKITWQTATKLLGIIVIVAGFATVTDLFGVLFQLKGIDYNYTGDITCGSECESYINLTTSYWRICFADYENTKYENETLFKKRSRSRTLHVNLANVKNVITTQKLVDDGPNRYWAPYDIEVDWLVPTYGKNWRPVKDGDCWNRGKVNKIKLVGHKNLEDTIKWSFLLGEHVDIDPLWIGKEKGFWNNTKLPIGMVSNPYHYNSTTQEMIDSTGLVFKTETNGVITVNDDRYLAFALKGTVGATEYTYTSMDFDWTWYMNITDDGHVFWADNDNPNFIWKQYYYFYEDPWKQMKIEHYLENNWNDINDMQMYYLMNVLPDDVVEYNETKYPVNDIMPIHKTSDFNEVILRINLNAEYDFDFNDLINDGFIINEFYMGSGSVIDLPNINITAIGFTKNNGFFPKGYNVTIDPTFSTNSVTYIKMAPLDTHTFVLVWTDDTENDITFAVYDTNGTIITSATDVANTGTAKESLGISSFDSNSFVVAYYNSSTPYGTNFRTYYKNGTAITSEISVETTAAANKESGVSVSVFDSNSFVISWWDCINEVIEFAIYNKTGEQVTSPTTIGSGIGSYSYQTSVSTFNDDEFVVGWRNESSTKNDVYFTTYYKNGTVMTSSTLIGNSSSRRIMSTSVLDSDSFVFGWTEYSASKGINRIYDKNGTAISDEIVLPSTKGDQISVSVINSSAYVVSSHYSYFSFPTVYDYIYLNGYDTNGNSLFSTITIDSLTGDLRTPCVISQQTGTFIELCDDNFIYAWKHDSTHANWTAYYSNGTVWDGICSEAGDTTKPTYSNNGYNTTTAGASVLFYLQYNDNTALHPDGQYIFSTNNTGAWVNESAVNFTATPNWANKSMTLNSTEGLSIGYRWYADDNAGNINNTGIFALTTTSADTCTCPGLATNWEINPSDNCQLNTDCNISTGNLTFTADAGNVYFNATITAFSIETPAAGQYFWTQSNCKGWIG